MEICHISVGGKEFRIRKVKDVDALFENYIQRNGGKANEEQIPYWAELWPAAIGLAEFISRDPEIVKGKIVHEIGCGLGLPGIVAGSLGAEKVIFSDLLEEPLEWVVNNWKLNLPGEPQVLKLDFTKQSIPAPADLILASDIAYERRLFPMIKRLFLALNPKSDILFSEPSRELAKDLIPLLKESGLDLRSKSLIIDNNSLKTNVLVHLIPQKTV